MRKENFLLAVLVTLLVFGCGAPATPSQVPAESPITISPTLTSTPPPTATERSATPTITSKPTTPTPTPEPGLQTNGPYLAYFQQDQHGIRRVVLMDADGVGRKVIELPKGINESFAVVKPPDPDIRWVSPDGRWLALRTGTAGNSVKVPAQGISDLTLNLLDLRTGEQQIITPLLSKDYPNNFVEPAEKLNDPNITAESLYAAFTNGIAQALDWSPDGRYLAFAGQMDGLSSDLYVYDVETKAIRRLSSGHQELQWIDWSPDGKWILHSSVYAVGAGMTFDIYVASADGSSVQYLTVNSLYDGTKDWLDSHRYFEYDSQNGPGDYGLRLVDIDTGKITKIWEGSFGSSALAKSGNLISIIAHSADMPYYGYDPSFVPAVYLINLKTLEKSRIEFPDTTHTYRLIGSFGLGGRDFVLMDQTSNNPVILSSDGTWTQTDLGDVNISVSPNSEYWLAVDGSNIRIFSTDNTLIKTIAAPFSDSYADFSWQPDSSGVFLISGSEIYSMSVPEGDIQLVETSLIESRNYALTYGWINGQ